MSILFVRHSPILVQISNPIDSVQHTKGGSILSLFFKRLPADFKSSPQSWEYRDLNPSSLKELHSSLFTQVDGGVHRCFAEKEDGSPATPVVNDLYNSIVSEVDIGAAWNGEGGVLQRVGGDRGSEVS